MTCNLKQYGTYPLNSVRKDVSANKFVVNIQNPPATCPDGEFISTNAILKVDSGTPSPLLSYSAQKHKPVITVASMSQVQEFNKPEGMGFGGFLLIVGALSLLGYLLYRRFNPPTLSKDEADSETPTGGFSRGYAAGGKVSGGGGNGGSGYAHGEGSVAAGGGGGGNTTVIHNSSNDGLLTGMLLGGVLSGGGSGRGGYSHDTEIIREREIIHDGGGAGGNSRDESFSSEENSAPEPSYESEKSESFSSESSSSDNFSSDSGGSNFGGDSGGGGGDFGGD